MTTPCGGLDVFGRTIHLTGVGPLLRDDGAITVVGVAVSLRVGAITVVVGVLDVLAVVTMVVVIIFVVGNAVSFIVPPLCDCVPMDSGSAVPLLAASAAAVF